MYIELKRVRRHSSNHLFCLEFSFEMNFIQASTYTPHTHSNTQMCAEPFANSHICDTFVCLAFREWCLLDDKSIRKLYDYLEKYCVMCLRFNKAIKKEIILQTSGTIEAISSRARTKDKTSTAIPRKFFLSCKCMNPNNSTSFKDKKMRYRQRERDWEQENLFMRWICHMTQR